MTGIKTGGASRTYTRCRPRAAFAVCLLAVLSTPGLAAEGSSAASTRANSQAWNVYRADAKFADVFGRAISLPSGASGALLNDPTLSDIARAGSDPASGGLARDALQALLGSVAPGASSCAGLLALKLPWLRILSAEEVAADKEALAHCKVLAVVDKEINIEVDLPSAAAWNGKFLMGGGGGFLGTLQNGMKPAALHRGYATAVSDTGHPIPKDAGGSWAYRDPERLANFGHRGTHLAQANAKLIVQAYYKKAIQKSYFYGSSGSGRLAMMQAQRYPEDFDGIVAACPAFNWTKGLAMSMAWTQQAMYPTAEDQYAYRPVVPAVKVKALDEAVYNKCDRVDGLVDGVITTPTACKFDPMEDLPRCRAGQDLPQCFTSREAEVIARIHRGPSNSSGPIWSGWAYGGESISGQWTAAAGTAYVIGVPPRGEAGAPRPYSSRHYLLSNESLRYLVYGDPDYDLHSFNFETDPPGTLAAAAQIDADDPDLGGLKARNGKLIMWVGYSDWAVNALSSVDYYERVLAKMGGRRDVGNYARLFLLPGVGHCSSADPERKTPNVADFLTALEFWVEKGIAPDSVIASHVVAQAADSGGNRPMSMPIMGKVDRTRPLCPYPEVATYRGTGSIDDAANFVCRAP